MELDKQRTNLILVCINTTKHTLMKCVFFVVGLSRAAHGAHCTFKIALSQSIMITLMLVCAFSPRVHSIPRGPPFNTPEIAGHNASVCKQPPNADLYALILAFARVSASVISTNTLNPTNAAMRLCFFMPLLSYVQAHAKTARVIE